MEISVILGTSNYLFGTGESYGPTAQHSQDCPIFLIQLNCVHILKQNKVLPTYLQLPCHKMAPGIPLPHNASQFSHIAWLHFLQQLIKPAKIYLCSLLSINYFCWIDLVCIYRCAFRDIVGLSPSISIPGDDHVSWSTWFLQMACICQFVSLCPAQSLLWIYWMWVHSQCSLDVLYLVFQLFRCRKLALTRDTSFLFEFI